MSAPSSILRLEVVAAHSTVWTAEEQDRFRRGVSTVVERVAQSIRMEHPSFQLQTRAVTSEHAWALKAENVTFGVAVLDVTKCDEPLALFTGRLQGARVPCILVCHASCEDAARRLGLNDPDMVTYTSIDELFLADSILQQELLRALPQARIHEELIYRFWFPRETSTVWVICPQIHNPGEFANRSSPDYTYLDNLGDTDALLEIMVYLSRYYPNATIERFSARDLPDGHTSGNLVVIGGPGSADDIGNEICGEMMREIGSHVSYSSDCEQMTVSRRDGEVIQLRAEYRTEVRSISHQQHLGLRQDQGYFARFANPLNQNATVVLINGIHTAGVLGAARAFSERRESLRNFNAVQASGANPASFECHFDVQVLNGQVKVPSVSLQNILPLGGAILETPPSNIQRAPVRDSTVSVTILFIAGDRGGMQVNQLKIPNEYHEIQNALRACKHRDQISLANPILAATRARLGEAYQDRPGIIHFAGHGDERSLSIIEDHGLVANETPLNADQLCDLLKTMEVRVRLCVLNTCASEALARQLVQAEAVQCAIGWPAKVSDSAAIAFSRALYAALGDGRTIADAVQVATGACGPTCRPVLAAADGADSHVLVSGVGEKQ